MISPAINRIAEGKNAEWPLADLVDGRIRKSGSLVTIKRFYEMLFRLKCV